MNSRNRIVPVPEQAFPPYAQSLIAVSLIVVRFLGFLAITRHHEVGSGRTLEETFLLASRSFLNQHFRDHTAGKPQNPEPNFRDKSIQVARVPRLIHKIPNAQSPISSLQFLPRTGWKCQNLHFCITFSRENFPTRLR